jgi:SAM-dependent methyltransferase
MGRSAAETERLRVQGGVYAPHSTQLFRMAGIGPGMRVLDAGCGAGDVSMLLAELVGPTGTVLGIDHNPDIVALAKARADEAGLTNVSFLQADLAELRLDEPVDAVVGRLIVIHLPEPVALLRTLSGLVRSRGVLSFQELLATRTRVVPETPIGARCAQWVVDGLRSGNLDPDTALRLPALLREAGLAVEGAASAGPVGSADSAMPGYVADTIRTFLPHLLARGVVTEDEVGIDTLAERLADELRASNGMFWWAELAGVWARVP